MLTGAIMAAKKSKRPILPIVIVIVIALAIIGSLGGHGDNEPDNQNTTQSDATSTETQADEKQTGCVPKVGVISPIARCRL